MSRRSRWCVAGLGIAGLACSPPCSAPSRSPARPGPALADAEYDRCIARSNSTNVEWAACGGAWIEREDRRLNETWRRLLPKLPRQSRADLLAEQRAWIAYKDKACAFYRNGDFGREGQVLHGPCCLAGVIARRRDELADIEAFLAPQ